MKRFSSYLGNRVTSVEVFNIVGLPPVRFFGLSGETVTSPRHLEPFLAAVQYHRPKFLVVHLGGNDLDSDEDNTFNSSFFLTEAKSRGWGVNLCKYNTGVCVQTW